MQLPHQFQHFPQPTLLVVADRVSAKFWLAGGDAIEEIDSLAVPHGRKTDKDTSFVNVDSGGVSGPEQKDEEERIHHYIHALTERVDAFVRDGKAVNIVLVMEAELAHGIRGHLESHVAAAITKEVHKDLANMPMTEVLSHIFESINPKSR